MVFKDKKVLILISHPDDETIFCWPIFQDKTIEKTILTISSDIYNSNFNNRLVPLKSICDDNNIKLISLNYESDFYKTEGWPKTIYKQLHYFVRKKLNELDYDYLMTHNPYGEYGHPDHVLSFNLSLLYSKSPILFTDIISKDPDNWGFGDNENLKRIYYKDKVGDYTLDEDFYNYCRDEYLKYDVWTWGFDSIKKCGLYKI